MYNWLIDWLIVRFDYADVHIVWTLASFPSPLCIARRGSKIPAQVNNSESVWNRLRTVNKSVSNFMSSVKLTMRRNEADTYGSEDDSRQDIGRCVSMPNIEQEFLQKHSSVCWQVVTVCESSQKIRYEIHLVITKVWDSPGQHEDWDTPGHLDVQ